jgi:heme/copper-type cytochrome/quinol oxidase subunit 2
MKKMHKAAQWAYEAQKSSHNTIWNVWVMLAMPAVWLVWSIVLFIIGIMSFVWRGNAHAREDMRITEKDAMLIRIGTTILLSIGIFYFFAMTRTFSHYGTQMDEEWRKKVRTWSETELSGDVVEPKETQQARTIDPASHPPYPEANHLEKIVPEPGSEPPEPAVLASPQRSAASLSTVTEESPPCQPIT